MTFNQWNIGGSLVLFAVAIAAIAGIVFGVLDGNIWPIFAGGLAVLILPPLNRLLDWCIRRAFYKEHGYDPLTGEE